MKEVALGRIVISTTTGNKIKSDLYFKRYLNICLNRHKMGDWGDMYEGYKYSNDKALVCSDTFFSVYHYIDGRIIWIITSGDRSETVIVLLREQLPLTKVKELREQQTK